MNSVEGPAEAEVAHAQPGPTRPCANASTGGGDCLFDPPQPQSQSQPEPQRRAVTWPGPEPPSMYNPSTCPADADYNTPRSFRTDPEFCVMRERARARAIANAARTPPPSLANEDSSRSRSRSDPKKMTFYEYHALHPFPIDPSCADLEALPFSEEEFGFLCREIPDPMWNSTYCIERVHSLIQQALAIGRGREKAKEKKALRRSQAEAAKLAVANEEPFEPFGYKHKESFGEGGESYEGEGGERDLDQGDLGDITVLFRRPLSPPHLLREYEGEGEGEGDHNQQEGKNHDHNEGESPEEEGVDLFCGISINELSSKLESRIMELFKYYQLKSPHGVFVQDANTLTNVALISLGAEPAMVELFPFLPDIGRKALAHFRTGGAGVDGGFRMGKLSDLEYIDGIVGVLDDFGALITKTLTTNAQNADVADVELAGQAVELLEHFFKVHADGDRKQEAEFDQKAEQGNNNIDGNGCTITTDKKIEPEIFGDCLEASDLGSHLIRHIIEAPKIMQPESEDSPPFYLNVIGLLHKLIDRSDKIRDLALSSSSLLLDPLLLHLKTPDPNCLTLCRTVELIYSMLIDAQAKDKGSLISCSPEAFQVLLNRFIQQMHHSTGKWLRNLRNDAGFTIWLLTRHVPELDNHFGRYAFVIAGIIANNILGQDEIPFVLDSSPEDLELLEILLGLLALIVESDAKAEEIITEYELVDILMRLVIGPCSMLDRFTEDDPTFQRVVTCAWKVLSAIARRFLLLMLREEGVETILHVLKIYGEYGRLEPYMLAVLLDVVRQLLLNGGGGGDCVDDEALQTKTAKTKVVEYLVHKCATEILTGVLTQLTSKELPISEEPALISCLLSIAVLTRHDQAQRDIFLQGNGVKVLTLLMYKLIYEPAHRRHLNPSLQIAIAETVWRTLANSIGSLEMFVAYDGIFRLLELLEIAASPPVQFHILSTLVELCEYSRCIHQLLHWRRRPTQATGSRWCHSDSYRVPASRAGEVGGGGSAERTGGDGDCARDGDVFGDSVPDRDGTLSALLCELWRTEETRVGVARDVDGVISSLENPLKSDYAREYLQNQHAHGRSHGPASSSIGTEGDTPANGPACLDLVSSVRPKIYLLVEKIIEATNTEATVFGSLNLPNQVTMQIIINFLDLKRGELWLEMIAELHGEGVPLVESDATAIQRLRNISLNKVAAVIDTQRYLIARAKEHAEMHETELYRLLQQCHFQDHLLALKEVDEGVRTANYFLLTDKRLWQKAQLQLATKNANGGAGGSSNPEDAATAPRVPTTIHRTTDDLMNVTIWPAGRQKTIILHAHPTGGLHEVPSERPTLSVSEAPSTVGFASVASEDFDPSKKGTTIGFLHGQQGQLDERLVRHIPTRVRTDGELTIPGSNEEGYFEVSPLVLQKALSLVAAEQKKWNWSDLGDDKAWKMRTKWRSNWYP